MLMGRNPLPRPCPSVGRSWRSGEGVAPQSCRASRGRGVTPVSVMRWGGPRGASLFPRLQTVQRVLQQRQAPTAHPGVSRVCGVCSRAPQGSGVGTKELALVKGLVPSEIKGWWCSLGGACVLWRGRRVRGEEQGRAWGRMASRLLSEPSELWRGALAGGRRPGPYQVPSGWGADSLAAAPSSAPAPALTFPGPSSVPLAPRPWGVALGLHPDSFPPSDLAWSDLVVTFFL